MSFETHTKKSRKPRRKTLKPTAKVMGYQLNRMESRLKKLIPKPERKYAEQASTDGLPQIITSTGTVFPLLENITVGATETTFVGNMLTLRNMLLRLSMTVNTTAVRNFLRIVVIQDRQPNGTNASFGLVFDTNAQSGNVDFNSPLNKEFGKRFKPLLDKTFALSVGGTDMQIEKIFRKLFIRVEHDNDDTAVPVVFNTNNVLLFAISDQATNGPTLNFQSRIRYTDV